MTSIPTKRGVRKALETLPAGPENTYKEAWERICAQKPQQAELGKKILLWILHSTRPLRVQEVQHALAMEEGDDQLYLDGLVDEQELTSFCAGLVVVDEQSGFIGLVHSTTQEFFQQRKQELFPLAHEIIATTCITYLCTKDFKDSGACLKRGSSMVDVVTINCLTTLL